MILKKNPKCLKCGKILHVDKLYLGYRTYCSFNCSINSNFFKLTQRKQTCIQKYGVENPSQNKEIIEKKKQTDLKKYGVEYHILNKNVKEKGEETNLKKYGTKYLLKNKEIRDKIRQTNLKRYGIEFIGLNKNFQEKRKQTCLKKYGVEYPFQSKKIQNNIQQKMIEKYGEIYSRYIPKYNPNSIIYLDMISEKLGLPIQHALNGGEKNFARYWVDGYIEQYNICIEWDEKHHNSIKQKKKDIIREEFIIKNYNCYFVRINQNDFLENIETNLIKICNQINNILNIN